MQNKKFSQRLQYFLDKKNMRASELAKKSNLSESLISQYLNDKINPKNDKILIIAKVLNISVLELLGWDDESLKVTDEDIQNIGSTSEKTKDDILDIKTFNNIVDAMVFIKDYNVKFFDELDVNNKTVEDVISLVNNILTTTQETIREEREQNR